MDIIVPDAGKFFFPLRNKLKLFAENYSPDLLEKIVYAGIHASSSFESAHNTLKTLAEIEVSVSHIQRLTIRIAKEYDRQDSQESSHWESECTSNSSDPPVQAVSISVDGGRAQIREENHGRGVHNPSWIETKAACFQILESSESTLDPRQQLPKIFSNKDAVRHLVEGLKGHSKKEEPDKSESHEENKNVLNNLKLQQEEKESSKPKIIKQYAFADIVDAESFGHAIYYKANQYNLYAAPRKAFIGDGDKKIWAIYEENFRADNWIPILDFVHAVEYAFEAAKVYTKKETECWAHYVTFINYIWQGKALTVIRRLDKWIAELENSAKKETDKLITRIDMLKSIRLYFLNNLSRMNYPLYRKMGLPISSCYVESLIKQFNIRIKSTDKFWNHSSVKSVVKMKASLISDDNHYQRFWEQRNYNQIISKRHYQKLELKEAA